MMICPPPCTGDGPRQGHIGHDPRCRTVDDADSLFLTPPIFSAPLRAAAAILIV